MKEIKRLPGESDHHYTQRCNALQYLGKKYILAEPIKKPKEAMWKG